MQLNNVLNRMDVITYLICLVNIAVAWSLGRQGPTLHASRRRLMSSGPLFCAGT